MQTLHICLKLLADEEKEKTLNADKEKKRARCATLPHLKRLDMTNKVLFDLNMKDVMILAIALLVGACS